RSIIEKQRGPRALRGTGEQNIATAVRDSRVGGERSPIAQISGVAKTREIAVERRDKSGSRGERLLKRRARGQGLGIGGTADDHRACGIHRNARRRVGQLAAKQGRGQEMGETAVPLGYKSVHASAGRVLIRQRRSGRLRGRLEGSRSGGKTGSLR